MKYKKKKKLGSFPYVSVIFSITLALFLIGLFGLLILYSNKLKGDIQENITMQIYLDKFITENDKIRINKILTQKEYVMIEGETPLIEFISKEEAAEDFIKSTGEDFVEFLGENPLRDAFVITINPEYQNEESLKIIESELSKLDSVFEVAYVQNLVEAINNNIAKISLFLVALTVILLFVIVVLINNTIKLALFSQRFLIRSMQLVGAKAGFIIRPFVRRAGIQGFVAGILASALLFGFVTYFTKIIEGLSQLHSLEELLIIFGTLIALGLVIGVFSTYKAVRKYLKMSLDKLY